ncbi:C-type lectin domain family 7 member A-like [Oryctolagus cuniculus]|uniref:C-type lectin domain family 7 member A-like n=1 Tax=Oryctolagus cuniculus TaxID=9986 RepID=UPI003879F48E
MEEERVTYTELRVQSPLQQHRSPAASRAKGTACFEHRGFSAPLSPWKLIAVVLCLICLGLLFSVGILAAKLAERNSRNLIFSQETDQKGISQPSSKVWKCQPCGDGWQQHGKHCYSFSREQIPWSSCELHCSPLRSSFLKISTEGEMEFVKRMSKKQCFLYEDKFGFSLYYNSSQMKWVWLDGSAFILDNSGDQKSEIKVLVDSFWKLLALEGTN